VLMRGLDERGIVFFTDYDSRKGRELADNPFGAAVFLWRELDRQASVHGPVERTTHDESERYFRTRPRGARIGAWASTQSRPVVSRKALEDRYREMEERFPGDVPLPPTWGGFRIVPDAFEFWKGRLHRLHDRFRYTRSPADEWSVERLFP
jgi:pyridoxamine 5'-phosphate oxidase